MFIGLLLLCTTVLPCLFLQFPPHVAPCLSATSLFQLDPLYDTVVLARRVQVHLAFAAQSNLLAVPLGASFVVCFSGVVGSAWNLLSWDSSSKDNTVIDRGLSQRYRGMYGVVSYGHRDVEGGRTIEYRTCCWSANVSQIFLRQRGQTVAVSLFSGSDTARHRVLSEDSRWQLQDLIKLQGDCPTRGWSATSSQYLLHAIQPQCLRTSSPTKRPRHRQKEGVVAALSLRRPAAQSTAAACVGSDSVNPFFSSDPCEMNLSGCSNIIREL